MPMMIDPEVKLLAVLDKAEEYRGLAIRAKDRRERVLRAYRGAVRGDS